MLSFATREGLVEIANRELSVAEVSAVWNPYERMFTLGIGWVANGNIAITAEGFEAIVVAHKYRRLARKNGVISLKAGEWNLKIQDSVHTPTFSRVIWHPGSNDIQRELRLVLSFHNQARVVGMDIVLAAT